jgi:hypothetical protein
LSIKAVLSIDKTRRREESTSVRYFFRGFIKQTGTPVYGHAEAGTEDAAYEALSRNGVVTESLTPDPVTASEGAAEMAQAAYAQAATPAPARTLYGNIPQGTPSAGGYAPPPPSVPAAPQSAPPTRPAEDFEDQPPTELKSALNNALDAASSQVSFDALAEKYKGKRVWVVDREKIRYRVAKVVDGILAASSKEEQNEEMRKRVAEAIQGLFGNDRNIATERTPETVAAMKAAQAAPAAPAAIGAANQVLEEQIDRLAEMVSRAENVLASLALAANRIARGGGGGGGGGGGRGRLIREVLDDSQNEVLLEIFKSNLELRKQITNPGQPGEAAAGEPGGTAAEPAGVGAGAGAPEASGSGEPSGAVASVGGGGESA